MKTILITVLYMFAQVRAYNPYITSTDLRGCKKLFVGSSFNQSYSPSIYIHNLENNIPQNGEILRTKACFKGPSNLFVILSNSTDNFAYTLFGVIGGWGNTKSVFELNGQNCGSEQLLPPVLSSDYYTCGFIVLNNHVADSKGSAYFETRGLEPVMISCTTIEYPDQLQYITFGTRVEDVDSALILYDCPIDLTTVCRGDINLGVAVDVKQFQGLRTGV